MAASALISDLATTSSSWKHTFPSNSTATDTLSNPQGIIQKRASGITTDQELINKTLPILIVSSILALINIIVNTSVLVLILTRRKLRVVANVIMASMFLSHLCYSYFYTIPYVTYKAIDISSRIQLSPSSNIYCIIMLFVLPNVMPLNMNLHICAIAATQFISISAPFFYQNVLINGKPTIFIIVGLIWFLSFFIGFMPFIVGLYHWEYKYCVPKVKEEKAALLIPWNYFITIFRFALPFLFICLFYFRIYCIARQKSNNQLNHASDNVTQRVNACKAAKVIGVIIGVFIVCKLPRDATNIIRIAAHNYTDPDLFLQVHYWCEFVGIYASSIINPILYTYLNRSFRNEVTLLIRRYKIKRDNRYLCQKDRSSHLKSKSQNSRDACVRQLDNKTSKAELLSNHGKVSKTNTSLRQTLNESSSGSNIPGNPAIDISVSNHQFTKLYFDSPMATEKCHNGIIATPHGDHNNGNYYNDENGDDICSLLQSSYETVV
ncbi:5-hydroxytryptamine receptor 4 [Trichoplax sp. H2]|nr:5-hydroxytryptamine receptor 4 [Trichoplax sp. H2]|eukprot:RDD38542.1 5-hydroxytryptamine receptor 4 [Trichoplax sp. H2]